MKIIKFTITLSDILSLPVPPTSLSMDQELLRFMKTKGLVCKGVTNLRPVGELTWYVDQQTKSTHYTQYVER